MTAFCYLDFYIDNPVFISILSKYREFFENRGFTFETSEDTGNTVLSYSDDEAPYINVPTALKTAARDFVKYNRFDFFEDNDEMCDDLLATISSQEKEINNAYQRLKISYSYSGDEDSEIIHCQELKYENGQESYQEYDEEI